MRQNKEHSGQHMISSADLCLLHVTEGTQSHFSGTIRYWTMNMYSARPQRKWELPIAKSYWMEDIISRSISGWFWAGESVNQLDALGCGQVVDGPVGSAGPLSSFSQH